MHSALPVIRYGAPCSRAHPDPPSHQARLRCTLWRPSMRWAAACAPCWACTKLCAAARRVRALGNASRQGRAACHAAQLTQATCPAPADGYGRMAGKPALTLLHLGPGLSNALANLHNARRASTPLVNLVGE